MAKTAKHHRQGKFNWTVTSFEKNFTYFLAPDGSKSSHKYVKTLKGAERVVASLFQQGIKQVHVRHIRSSQETIYKIDEPINAVFPPKPVKPKPFSFGTWLESDETPENTL